VLGLSLRSFLIFLLCVVHHIVNKGRICNACVQSVLIYGTEMVRWMCGVSLKDRKRSEDLCILLNWY